MQCHLAVNFWVPAHVAIGRRAVVQHVLPDVDHVFEEFQAVLDQRGGVEAAVAGDLLDLQLLEEDVQHEHVTGQTLFGNTQRNLILLHWNTAAVRYGRYGAVFLNIYQLQSFLIDLK